MLADIYQDRLWQTTQKKKTVKIVCIPATIWIRHLPNTSRSVTTEINLIGASEMKEDDKHYIHIMHFVQRMHNKLSYRMRAVQNCKAIPCYPYGCNAWGTLAFWRFRILAVWVFRNAIQVIRAVLHIAGPCTQQNRVLCWIVRHTARNTYHH